MATPSEVARAFAGKVRGSVREDRVTRELYSTDASPYRILPTAVLRPQHTDDLHVAVEVCRELGVSITPRGSGTSFTGQCVGEGLNIDCSALDAIEWIDTERRVARVQPGARWWTLNEQAAKVGLHFGPDPATRRQCTVGGMTATNSGGTHSIVYGATVDHVARTGRDPRRRTIGPARRERGAAVRSRSAARRRARTGDAAARPGVLDARAPRRRLSAGASLHRNPARGEVPRRLRGDPRAVHRRRGDAGRPADGTRPRRHRVRRPARGDRGRPSVGADGPVCRRGRVQVDDRHRTRRRLPLPFGVRDRSGSRRVALRRVPRRVARRRPSRGSRAWIASSTAAPASGRATATSIRPRSCRCGRCARPASARSRTSPGGRTCRRRSSRTPSSPSTGSRPTSARWTSSSPRTRWRSSGTDTPRRDWCTSGRSSTCRTGTTCSGWTG